MFRNYITLLGNDISAPATVAIISSPNYSSGDAIRSVVIGAQNCAHTLNLCRRIPSSSAKVYLILDELCAVNRLNPESLNEKENSMNVFDQMHRAVDVRQVKPILMIMPTTEKVTEDGLLEFVTIERLTDLTQTFKANTVVMFRPDQKRLLELLCAYSDVFAVDPVVLSGVPAATYSADFESVTWDLPRMAYHSVVNDLLEAGRRASDAAEDVKHSSIYATEVAAVTRKSGDVKVFTGFEEHSTDDEITDGERDE